jgi:hypothetical protein
MTHNISLIAITPANFKPQAEELGNAMGHSGVEFTVPLTSTGGEQPTHFALHAWVGQTAADIWTGVTYPANTGFTQQQIDGVRNMLIISTNENITPSEHFTAVCDAHNLSAPVSLGALHTMGGTPNVDGQ